MSGKLKILSLILIVGTVLGAAKGNGEEMGRTLIIGIDGGDPELISEWLKSGKLPNIKNLTKEGDFSNLTTTSPIISPSAWTSFSTGTGPGKHGIFSFLKKENGNFYPIDSRDKKSKDLWETLSQENKKVIVMNVPLTYPPEEVEGVMISGFLANKEGDFTHPLQLSEKLRNENYIITGMKDQYYPSRKKEFIKDLKETINKRGETALQLMENREWDCFIIVFRATDPAQHYLWNDKEKVLEIYKEVDEAVGSLLEKTSENDLKMIISDHGFGKVSREFYINRFLMKENHLKLRSKTKAFLVKTGLTQHNIAKSLKKIRLFGPLVYLMEKLNLRSSFRDSLSSASLKSIDFSNTEAYATSYGEGIILEKDVGEKVKDKLEKRGLDAHKKEDIFEGPEVNNAPDLIVESKNTLPLGFIGHRKIIDNTPIKQGKHRKQGVLITNRKIEKAEPRITDVAPTVLEFFNISKDHMNGSSLINFENK